MKTRTCPSAQSSEAARAAAFGVFDTGLSNTPRSFDSDPHIRENYSEKVQLPFPEKGNSRLRLTNNSQLARYRIHQKPKAASSRVTPRYARSSIHWNGQ